MQALDILFPIGAFTLSNGMETYTQKEIVTDKNSLERFLTAYIYALPTSDLGFAAKAASDYDFTVLDELCTAAKSPYELRNGSEKLCARFLKAEKALSVPEDELGISGFGFDMRSNVKLVPNETDLSDCAQSISELFDSIIK